MTAPEPVADGIWRWTARHPEWHPGEWGAEVASFLVHHGDATVLIDPLLAEGTAERLDPLIAGDVVVGITIPYHVRSTAEVIARWGGIAVGHPALPKRLPAHVPFTEAFPGAELPGGLRAHAAGRTYERPLGLPFVSALAFGDRIVGVDGRLRFWMPREVTPERVARHRRLVVPELEPLIGVDPERVLVTHGPPVLRNGRSALEEAIHGEPWYHRAS
jgi:hypothetical protein